MTQHGGAASAGACPPIPPGDAGERQVLRTCTRTCTNAFDCERLEPARRPHGQMTADQFCLARGSPASAQAAALLLAPFHLGYEVLRSVGCVRTPAGERLVPPVWFYSLRAVP